MFRDKYYCEKCRRFLNISKFKLREDRPCAYSWCEKCCEKTPLFANIFVNDSWIKVLEKNSRTVDFPAESDRGFGVIV